MLKEGRFNLVFGAVILLVGTFGGIALAMTLDPILADGEHDLASVRFFFRDAHSHAMPFALLNLIVGLLIPRLALSDRSRTVCGVAAAGSLFLPLALFLRGALYPSAAPAPLAFIGATCFMVTSVLVIIGAMRPSPAMDRP